MSGTSNKIDIVALTETSEKEDIGFIGNVEIDGYQKFNTASNSSKGGTAIYVNKYFDSFERIDLSRSSAVDMTRKLQSSQDSAWMGDRSGRLNSTRVRVDHVSSDH